MTLTAGRSERGDAMNQDHAVSRNVVAQGSPPPGTGLASFPSVVLAGGERKYRAHSVDYGPWFFSNSGFGRFDLAGKRGTCYLADTVETAMRESLGTILHTAGVVTAIRADSLKVSLVGISRKIKAANINDPAAARHHVTRELATMGGYEIPQAWSAAVDGAGFGAIRYATRFTTDPGPNAWAIFGAAGPDAAGIVYPDEAIRGRQACADSGIIVVGTPPARSLTIAIPSNPRTSA